VIGASALNRRIAAFLENKQKQEREHKQAIHTIESFYLKRLEQRKSKDLREQLSKLPYACRRSFVKMYDLKQNTLLFKAQA